MNRQENNWLQEFAKRTGENLDEFVARRNSGEPLQYILGEWEFYGYNFKVGKGVLIPRPETEFLVDLAKEHKPQLLYDLCAGSGCVGIALAKELKCKVTAIEKYSEAIKYLKQNVKLNKVKIEVIQDDVLNMRSALINFEQTDCILVNPPYLSRKDMESLQKEVVHEPEEALFGGEDGLDFYRKVFTLWGGKLKKGGLFAVEVGDGQADNVCELMQEAGFEPRIRKDYNKIKRIVYSFKT